MEVSQRQMGVRGGHQQGNLEEEGGVSTQRQEPEQDTEATWEIRGLMSCKQRSRGVMR